MVDDWKPSEKEDEYFARLEMERRKKAEEEKTLILAETEARVLKETHFMKCPKCGRNLFELDYQGIRIDQCSSCQGIWLDQGELETILKLDKGVMRKLFSVFGS